MPNVKDVYVITYGSKWGWKYSTSIVQKLYKEQEDAIFYASQAAKQWNSDVYLEGKDGKFKKLLPPNESTKSKPNRKGSDGKDN